MGVSNSLDVLQGGGGGDLFQGFGRICLKVRI